MSPSLDLTLPLKVLTERYRKERHDISPRAIYSLVDLREGGADELLKVIEADDGNLRDTCRVAPEPYTVITSSSAQNQDYKKDGVLLVNLDTDLGCYVDTCRIKAEEAASALINIAIANMDWEDFKEDELPFVESVTAGVESSAISCQAEATQQSYAFTPNHVFGAYTIAGTNMINICELL